MLKRLINKNKEEIILSVIFLFFAFGFNLYRVIGDGALYYGFLENIIDVMIHPEKSLKTGFMQSGCAYFNAPFYIVARILEKLFQKNWDFNGITLRTISINLASNFYMLMSIILSVRVLKKLNFKRIITSVFAVLFSTYAFVAAVITPSWSHTVDIFVITLFIYMFLEYEDSKPFKSAWLGILQVICLLVRYLNILLMAPIITYYFCKKEYAKIKYFFAGFIGTAWIIPLIFYIYNGGFFTAFYSKEITRLQLNSIVFWPKYFFKYLVHPLHGLFIWSPVLVLSVTGLLIFPKEKKKIGYLFFTIWLLYVFVYGYNPHYHCGWSFSNRYLSGLFLIYIIGLAAFLERYKNKRSVFLVICCTFYSIFLFFNWCLCVIHGELETPLNMVEAWIKGESLHFVGGRKVNLPIFLKMIWQWCRYKYLFRF